MRRRYIPQSSRQTSRYVIELQGRSTDGVRGLRATLKRLGRVHRLRCVGAREINQRSPDRAAVLAMAILQIIEQHEGATAAELYRALRDYLADEIADTVRQTVNEIRPESE